VIHLRGATAGYAGFFMYEDENGDEHGNESNVLYEGGDSTIAKKVSTLHNQKSTFKDERGRKIVFFCYVLGGIAANPHTMKLAQLINRERAYMRICTR